MIKYLNEYILIHIYAYACICSNAYMSIFLNDFIV